METIIRCAVLVLVTMVFGAHLGGKFSVWINFIDWLFNCCFDATLSGTVCQWHTAGRWFSQGTPVFTTNKTDCHDIISYLRSYP
jgi:hypothetical protein